MPWRSKRPLSPGDPPLAVFCDQRIKGNVVSKILTDHEQLGGRQWEGNSADVGAGAWLPKEDRAVPSCETLCLSNLPRPLFEPERVQPKDVLKGL